MSVFPFGGLDGVLFSLVPVLVVLVFAFVFGMLIVRSVQGAKQWKRNNSSPRLTVDAAVATKRTSVHHSHHNTATDNPYHTSSTTYYATFEVASGDRLELKLSGTEYGQLAEGDRGQLTFQGTRYLGFERSLNSVHV